MDSICWLRILFRIHSNSRRDEVYTTYFRMGSLVFPLLTILKQDLLLGTREKGQEPLPCCNLAAVCII